MSTDNPGAPQQPSGADRPQDPQDQNTSASTPAGDEAPEQPTRRIPRAGEPGEGQEQPTQQIPTSGDSQGAAASPPAAPQAPASQGAAPTPGGQQQPRYGQMAPGSPYQVPQGHYQSGQQQSGQQPYGHGQYPYGQGHYQQGQYGQYPQGQYPQGQYGQAAYGTPSEGQAAQEPRRRSVWVPVVSAAVVAAVLASLGTAAATGAFDSDGSGSSSLADVGSGRDADEAPVSATDEDPNWEAVTSSVAPSVVAIQTQNSEGSGVVYDDEGHVLTNNHVVSGAQDGVVQLSLEDGRLYEAKIVGTDPTTDLAVVQIQDPPDDLKPAAFGDSEDVQVGDPVLAVGNPLGLANTATTGIVSALDRPVAASGEDTDETVVTNAIQIDAAINPGNSGGPLFNAKGQVTGITSSIASLSSGMGSQSGSIGLGFAIPVNLAANIADQLIENGSAEHAFLGVSMTDTSATADGVTRRGAQVVEVTGGSPADEAGLQPGDVIVAIDDDPVAGAESLTGYVREKEANQQVKLTYVRDGETRTADATLVVRSEDSSSQGQGSQGGGSQDGGSQGDGSQGQGSQDGLPDGGSQGSDPSQPDNIPGWLEDLLQGGS